MSIYAGDTKLLEKNKIAHNIGLDNLYLKMEKQNPSGSHKDRAVFFMLDEYTSRGYNRFAISSSGNAAISAIYWTVNADIDIYLDVFISENINPKKEEKIEKLSKGFSNITIHKSKRPKTDAYRYAQTDNMVLLRTSTDDLAIEGYKNLGKELHLALRDSIFLSHIFVPTSSGATLLGIYKYFIDNKLSLPRIYLCQTSAVHPMAGEFDKDFTLEDSSLADGIVDRIAHRKNEVIAAVKDSRGEGIVVENRYLRQVKKAFSRDSDIYEAGWESMLAFASLLKMMEKGSDINSAVLIFTS